MREGYVRGQGKEGVRVSHLHSSSPPCVGRPSVTTLSVK